MDEVVVKMCPKLGSEAVSQVLLFRSRFEELWRNWESLKRLGIELGGSFQKHGDGRISGGGCGIETHRLKGFYLDFRFFWAEKEPTHYFKIASLVGKHCQNAGLRRCLKANKKMWHEAGLLDEWHGVSVEEMTGCWFKGALFHSAPDKKTRLADIRRMMNDDLAHHELTYSIYSRMLVIRNLCWVLHPFREDSQYLRIPSKYAQGSAPAGPET